MKICLIFLSLLLGSGLAKATVQTFLTQDKPPRLYVATYTAGGSSAMSDIIGTGTFTGIPGYESSSCTATHQDGGNGSASWSSTTTEFQGPPNAAELGSGVTIDNGSYTEYYADGIEVSNLLADILTFNSIAGWSSTSTNIVGWNGGIPGTWENANITVSTNIPGVGNVSISRNVTTILKLQTGGKSTSHLQNVFQFYATATQVAADCGYFLSDNSWFTQDNAVNTLLDSISNISSQNISIGSYGALNTNYYKYVVLPDNANVVVTPKVAVNDYTFNMPTPTKYHSYLELFTESANSSDVTLGHAFWRLSTDAPTNAFPFVPSTWLQFLGQCEGFYPDNKNDPYGHPGKLQSCAT